MAKRRRPGRFITQAQQDAIVRFGPEISGLKALIQQAHADRAQGVSSAKSTASSITNAINQATPAVAHIYQQAGATTAAASNRVQADIAGLQGLNPNIVAAIAAERANASTGVTSSRASTLTGLQTQKVAAQRGRQFAIQRANSDYVDAASKVLQRNLDLGRERGAFVIGEAGKAREAAAQRRQQMREVTARLTAADRNSIRASGIDPNTGGLTQDAKTAAQRLKIQQQAAVVKQKQAAAKKVKSKYDATADSYKQATSQIGQALGALRTLDPARDPKNRRDLGQLLLSGHKGDQVYTVDPTGKHVPRLSKTGTPIKTPDVPRIDQAYATAALDMYYMGYVSPNTVKLLHNLGLKVGRLPVTPKSRRPPAAAKPRPVPRPANPNAGVFGQVVGKLGV